MSSQTSAPGYEISFGDDTDHAHPLYLDFDELDFVCSQSLRVAEIVHSDQDAEKTRSVIKDESGKCAGPLIKRMLQALRSEEWPWVEPENCRSLKDISKVFLTFGSDITRIQRAAGIKELRRRWLLEYAENINEAGRKDDAGSRALIALYLDWEDLLQGAAGDLLLGGPEITQEIEEQESGLTNGLNDIRNTMYNTCRTEIGFLLWNPSNLDARQREQLEAKLRSQNIYSYWAESSTVVEVHVAEAIHKLQRILQQFSGSASTSNEMYHTGQREDDMDEVVKLLMDTWKKLKPDQSRKRKAWANLQALVEGKWSDILKGETANLCDLLLRNWSAVRPVVAEPSGPRVETPVYDSSS